MKTRSDLYEAAFRYRKTGFWKRMTERDMFAVRLSGGETAYVNVESYKNQIVEFCALRVYVGEAGAKSCLTRLTKGANLSLREFEHGEIQRQQNCLTLLLESKASLRPEEAEEVQSYADAHGVRLGGGNSYPMFVKNEPNRDPWKVQDEADIAILWEVIEAAILINDRMRLISLADMGFAPVDAANRTMPLFAVAKRRLMQLGSTELPAPEPVSHRVVAARNTRAIEAVNALHRKGVWQAELVRSLTPVEISPDEAPYYPLILIVTDGRKAHIIHMQLEHEMHPTKMLDAYANELIKGHYAPEEIQCRDVRTYALLKDFCRKTGIPELMGLKSMPPLDAVEQRLLQRI